MTMKELNYKVSHSGWGVRVTHKGGRADFLDVPPECLQQQSTSELIIKMHDPARPPFITRSSDGKSYTFRGLPGRVVRAACEEWYIAELVV
jgi:hypothetical protein